MAIIILAAPVSGIRGKVGGLIYSQNKGGPFVKAWAKGSNQRSLPQTSHRGNLSYFAAQWRGISAASKTAWDVYAALPAQDKVNSLGETYSASGFNWFIEINLNRRAVGQAQMDTAPTLTTPATPVVANFLLFKTAGSALSRFRLSVASPNLTFEHIVKVELYKSIGRTSVAEIKTFVIAGVPLVGDKRLYFQTELDAIYGTIQVGQKGFATIQSQDGEGRRSAPVAASDEVSA